MIFTVRKRSCGKVIFLHLSVSHSVHRGVCIPACTGQTPPFPGETPSLIDTPRGQTPPYSVDAWRHTPSPDPTPRIDIATAADGTHPTGMQSCYGLEIHLRSPKIQTLARITLSNKLIKKSVGQLSYVCCQIVYACSHLHR